MVFSSLVFLCVFLPITFIVYYLLPGLHARNALLIIVSLFFYAYGEPSYVILMLASALLNWLFGLAIMKSGDPRVRKRWVIIAFIIDLLVLGVYKYTGMVVTTLNSIAGCSIPVPDITLPIGISFYTFQAMSYVSDVYRRKVSGTRNFAKVLLYICFFPQLIAGPIVRYVDVADEIDSRSASIKDICQGLRRFSYGLAKKVLIANTLGEMVDYIYAQSASDLSMIVCWIAAVGYALQIYFDFSGYSDMAIGLGRMFGFHFLENFDHPYSSGSMIEFWRKWHISLTSWFRDNLYIPLGGNRKGKRRTWINRFIVFFFTGLWHGASWTFVLWGLFHGLLTSIEAVRPNFVKRMGWLSHVYVLVAVMIGFVLFRSDTVAQTGVMLSHMFIPAQMTSAQWILLGQTVNNLRIAALIAGCILCLPVRPIIAQSVPAGREHTLAVAASYALALGLLLICMMTLAGGAYNPFIYFRF